MAHNSHCVIYQGKYSFICAWDAFLWHKWLDTGFTNNMNSMKIIIPLHRISWKKTPTDTVTPQRQNQFTSKMKANAVPRLLSSLVWIDQCKECNGMTSFIEFTRQEIKLLFRFSDNILKQKNFLTMNYDLIAIFNSTDIDAQFAEQISLNFSFQKSTDNTKF